MDIRDRTDALWNGHMEEGMHLTLPLPLTIIAEEGPERFELRASNRNPLSDVENQLAARRRDQSPYQLMVHGREARNEDFQEGAVMEIMSDNHRRYREWRCVRYALNSDREQSREEPPRPDEHQLMVQVGEHWLVTHHHTAGELREELIISGMISTRASMTMNGKSLEDSDPLISGATIRTSEGLRGGRDKVKVKLSDGVHRPIEVEIHGNPSKPEWDNIIRDLCGANKLTVGPRRHLQRGREKISWETPLVEGEELYLATENRPHQPEEDWRIPVEGHSVMRFAGTIDDLKGKRKRLQKAHPKPQCFVRGDVMGESWSLKLTRWDQRRGKNLETGTANATPIEWIMRTR
jgi:hypothetical protein